MRRVSVPILSLRPPLPLPSLFSTSKPSPSPPISTAISLTAGELAEINALIPRLAAGGHHPAAILLLSAALLTSAPLSSLPVPSLASSLAAAPDLAPAMALLSALRHHPRRPSPLPFFSSRLLSAFFAARRLRDAAKVLAWLCRADSPWRPDVEIYGIAIEGFCRHRRALEAVRVVREMVRDEIDLDPEVRAAVCRSLMWEARVDEARELEAEFEREAELGERFRRVAELLDQMIRDWRE